MDFKEYKKLLKERDAAEKKKKQIDEELKVLKKSIAEYETPNGSIKIHGYGNEFEISCKIKNKWQTVGVLTGTEINTQLIDMQTDISALMEQLGFVGAVEIKGNPTSTMKKRESSKALFRNRWFEFIESGQYILKLKSTVSDDYIFMSSLDLKALSIYATQIKEDLEEVIKYIDMESAGEVVGGFPD